MDVQQQARSDESAGEWDVVRRLPADVLRGEPKLAWLFLWSLAGGRPNSLKVSGTEVGADQGTSSKAGTRCLEALERLGFIDVAARHKGHWAIYLNQPSDVLRARRAAQDADQQRRLPFAAEGGEGDVNDDTIGPAPPADPPDGGGGYGSTTAAVMGPQPPLRALNLETRNAHLTSTSTLHSEVVRNSDQVKGTNKCATIGGCGAITAAGSPAVAGQNGPVAAGDVLAAFAASLPSQADQQRQVDQLVAWIVGRVRDASLYESEARRVAWSIVEGELPRVEVDTVFVKMDEIQRGAGFTHGRANYFVRTMQRIAVRRGLAAWRKAR